MNRTICFVFGTLFLMFSSLAQDKITNPYPHFDQNAPVSKEIIITSKEFRGRLLSDRYRPAFHFIIPEGDGRPADPNGAFYHNGRYHLMYLYNREGLGFSWGHVSSADLIHWRHHPDAIVPGDGDDGCFSGGAFVDDDGSAVLSYWMLWGNKGIGIAKSNDENFNSWKKFSNNPVVKSTEWGITTMKRENGIEFHVGSADPSNIWKKEGKYFMLTGNLLVLRKLGSRGDGLPANDNNAPPLPQDSLNYQGDRLYLFSSYDLRSWKYEHEFYTSDRKWTSKTEDNMCPSFLPLPSAPEGGKSSGKHLLLFISHNMGAQYYVGEYKGDRFYPNSHGRMSWKDNAYFAPEALVDAKGRQIMWSWIFDDRPDSIINYYGWTGMYGLPRSLWLGKNGKLKMQPVKELQALRLEKSVKSNIQVASDSEVSIGKTPSELMEIEITFQPNTSYQYGIKVCVSDDGREETLIYYDAVEKKLKFDTRKSGLEYGRKLIEEAPFELEKGEPLVLKIFIDKSVIEVFANDRQAIARMVYPTLGGRGLSVFSKGGQSSVKKITSWQLFASNPY